MNTKVKLKGVSLQKATADSERVRLYAWAYIVLNADGSVESFSSREPEAKTPFIAVIAILGPASVRAEDGTHVSVPDALLCEIGLQRGRPYGVQDLRSEWSVTARLPRVHKRRRVREMSYDECAKALPTIEDLFFHYVVQRIRRWKFVERRRAGKFYAEPSVRVTVSRSDRHFARLLLREDWAWRQMRFKYSRPTEIRSILKRLNIKKSTDRMIRANSVAREAAAYLRGLLPLEISFLKRAFPEGSETAAKLHHIRDVFDIADGDGTEDGKLLFGEPCAPFLPLFRKVHCSIPRRSAKKRLSEERPQGKGSIVGEVFLDLKERLELFPQSSVYFAERAAQLEDAAERAAIIAEGTLPDDPSFDDIPF